MFMDFLKGLSLFGPKASAENMQELVGVVESQADLNAAFDVIGLSLLPACIVAASVNADEGARAASFHFITYSAANAVYYPLDGIAPPSCWLLLNFLGPAGCAIPSTFYITRPCPCMSYSISRNTQWSPHDWLVGAQIRLPVMRCSKAVARCARDLDLRGDSS